MLHVRALRVTSWLTTERPGTRRSGQLLQAHVVSLEYVLLSPLVDTWLPSAVFSSLPSYVRWLRATTRTHLPSNKASDKESSLFPKHKQESETYTSSAGLACFRSCASLGTSWWLGEWDALIDLGSGFTSILKSRDRICFFRMGLEWIPTWELRSWYHRKRK